jgi:hypothetical protein
MFIDSFGERHSANNAEFEMRSAEFRAAKPDFISPFAFPISHLGKLLPLKKRARLCNCGLVAGS